MDTLVLRNVGTSYEYVNDIGIGVAPGEDLDLIPNFNDEDILESLDLETAMSGDLEVWLNGTTQLTYQDLIDYLTKLTHYDVIDYAYITSEDVNTDVTALELEELTDGSDTTLHIHDNRYYTETELQTSGSASVHWDNLTNVPANTTVIYNNQLFIYDTTRSKWLSVFEHGYLFSDKAVKNKFMDVGSNFGFDVGYVVPFEATITRITILAAMHYTGKNIEIRKNNTTILTTKTMTSQIHYFNDEDVDVNTGDFLQVFVSGSGGALKRATCNIYIRERKV